MHARNRDVSFRMESLLVLGVPLKASAYTSLIYLFVTHKITKTAELAT